MMKAKFAALDGEPALTTAPAAPATEPAAETPAEPPVEPSAADAEQARNVESQSSAAGEDDRRPRRENKRARRKAAENEQARREYAIGVLAGMFADSPDTSLLRELGEMINYNPNGDVGKKRLHIIQALRNELSDESRLSYIECLETLVFGDYAVADQIIKRVRVHRSGLFDDDEVAA
jgi:hypothetical protein